MEQNDGGVEAAEVEQAEHNIPNIPEGALLITQFIFLSLKYFFSIPAIFLVSCNSPNFPYFI